MTNHQGMIVKEVRRLPVQKVSAADGGGEFAIVSPNGRVDVSSELTVQ